MSGSEASVRNRKWLVALAVVLGVALIVVAVIYWIEPAGSLPSFFPGHEAGSEHHHVKHGIAAFLVGLACLAFAWFNTGPKTGGAETGDDG
jgi:drug/metabolite transporter (DMT)-like permease